jgi:hypothetical protein
MARPRHGKLLHKELRPIHYRSHCRRGHTPEHTCIVFQPNTPNNQHQQRVGRLSSLPWTLSSLTEPPLHKPITSHWREVMPTTLAKTLEPYLAVEGATYEKVVTGFSALRTQGTCVVVIQTIPWPNPILQ